MRRADGRWVATLLAVTALGLLVGLSPALVPSWAQGRLRHDLAGAARAAPGLSEPVGQDLGAVLADLAIDAEVRAGQALYDAALLVTRRGVARVALPSPALDTHH